MESAPVESNGRAPSLAEDPALGLSHRAKLEILGAVLLALFLGALDQTIVGTALPSIATQLGGNELYGSAALDQLTGVGTDLGAQVLVSVPEQFQAVVEPFIDQIVLAIHEAFTVAITQTFWIGVATTAAAFVVAIALREIPLRAHHGEAPVGTAASPGDEQPVRLTGAPAAD